MKLRITNNISQVKSNFKTLAADIKSRKIKVLREIAKAGKESIKEELRSPNKTGTTKSARRRARYRRSPERRSAVGESLARDTGVSEKLITSTLNNSSVDIGFKENPFGFNYVAWQELENERPTIAESLTRTSIKIRDILNKNYKI